MNNKVKKEIKNFLNVFKPKKHDCGCGIKINMIYISDQDIVTLVERIINLTKK